MLPTSITSPLAPWRQIWGLREPQVEKVPGPWPRGQPPTVVNSLICSHMTYSSFVVSEREQLGPTSGGLSPDLPRFSPILWSCFFHSSDYTNFESLLDAEYLFYTTVLSTWISSFKAKWPFVCLLYSLNALNHFHADQRQTQERPYHTHCSNSCAWVHWMGSKAQLQPQHIFVG